MGRLNRLALAGFFVAAGIGHFLAPQSYLAIMPRFVPWPKMIVAFSGAAEILGGLGVCFGATRRAAGWGLIGLLLAVFPANLQAIATGMVIAGQTVPAWLLWARLPFQFLLLAWVYRVCLRRNSYSR